MAIYTGELIKRNFAASRRANETIIDCEYIDESNGGLLLDLIKAVLRLSAQGQKVVITGSKPELRKVLTRLCYRAEIEFAE